MRITDDTRFAPAPISGFGSTINMGDYWELSPPCGMDMFGGFATLICVDAIWLKSQVI